MLNNTVNELFNIPEENKDSFLAKIDKLNRKIAKKGFKDAYLSADPVGWHNDEAYEKAGKIHRIYEIYVYAENLNMGDYTFMGRLRHDKTTGTLVETAPGKKIPAEYRKAAHTNCDHCHVKRYRTETFVLKHNETGEFVQVGRTCLKDFLGHDVEKLIWLAQFISSFYATGSNDLKGEFIPRNHNYVELQEYLAFVVRVLKSNAWVSRGQAYQTADTEATANTAWNEMAFNKGWNGYKYVNEFVPATDEERTEAQVAIDHFVNVEATNDYLNNCQVIAKEGEINHRDAGYAASMVNAMLRENVKAEEKKKQTDTSNSVFVGAIGERAQFTGTVLFTKDINTYYGASKVTKFATEDGNVLTVFAGNWKQSPQVGATLTFKGTVKKHETYEGEQQTTLKIVKEI